MTLKTILPVWYGNSTRKGCNALKGVGNPNLCGFFNPKLSDYENAKHTHRKTVSRNYN